MMSILRKSIKVPLVLAKQLGANGYTSRNWRRGYIFLAYHKVTVDHGLELELDARLFLRQMDYLAESGRVIAYSDAIQRLRSGVHADGPLYVLTFDDGYLDFYTHAFPVLQDRGLPAILFVTTGFVEDAGTNPLLAAPELSVRPVTWDMLNTIQQSGHVELGAHTHTHPELHILTANQVEAELLQPIDLFRAHLGIRPRHFAYPRGLATPFLSDCVRRHYESAVVGGGQAAVAGASDLFAIPRVPVRRSDGWRFFKAKLRGQLVGEEALYSRIHALRQPAQRTSALFE